MNEPTISTVIFGRDNEDTIERLLKSVKPFTNEILYMDTGSTDKTLSIVRQYTSRIYIVENMIYRNNDNFRNFLNSESTSQWTLFCDTDEVVTKQFANEVKGFLKQINNIPKIHHVYFKWADLIYDEQHMLTTPDFHPFLYNPRLALKQYARWERSRHEIFIGEGEGVFWDIFALAHYNLLKVDRLRYKLGNPDSIYGEYDGLIKYNKDTTDEEVLEKFIGKAVIGEVPNNVIW